MVPMKLTDIGGMEIVSVNHKPYMFTNMRVERKTLPDGFVAYDIRDDDECGGTFAQIKNFVMVNHWGTLIGTDELPLDPEWYEFIPESEEDYWFTGDYVKTLEEFVERYEELEEQCK